MTFLAPCGHPGIPVTVNYVTCTTCDSTKSPVPVLGVRTFHIHLFNKNLPRAVHSIKNVKIPNIEVSETIIIEIDLLADCYLHSYRSVLLNNAGEVALPPQMWENDFTHDKKIIIGAGHYIFAFKVPPLKRNS